MGWQNISNQQRNGSICDLGIILLSLQLTLPTEIDIPQTHQYIKPNTIRNLTPTYL